jgi:hypothetical protein
MRLPLAVLLLATAITASACGTTRRTTVVAVPEGSTAVVVPSDDGDTKVITPR